MASETLRLELFVGGGIAASGPNFNVTLDRDGKLNVRRTGLPVVAPGKFTETSTSLKIKPSEAKALIALAERSKDFGQGCRPVLDGTTARLSLRTRGGVVKRECIAAASWPNGRKTKDFLTKLNLTLPKNFQIY